jgi:hypothetical protein
MKQAVEVVVFRPLGGVSQDVLETAARGLTPILRAMPGFVSREFAKSEDGQYVDIVNWADMESAKHAAEVAMSIPACLEFFKLIDPSQMNMMHFHKQF